MKQLIATCLLLLSIGLTASTNSAAYGDYTYQTDKKIQRIEQLVGQTFVPQEYVEGYDMKRALKPGEITIEITPNAVLLKGVNKIEKLAIIGKAATRLGFEFKLADQRGKDVSKLKIVTNKYKHVQLLYLYSKKYGEHTFFLPLRTKTQIEREKAYFTSAKKYKVNHYADIVGKRITPNQQHANVTNPNEVLEKVSMKQQLNITFADTAVVFKDAKASTAYKIAKAKKVKNHKSKYDATVTQVMPIKVKGKTKKINVFLNENNQIVFVGVQNAQYFLQK